MEKILKNIWEFFPFFMRKAYQKYGRSSKEKPY